jgi:hypothetical protein
VHVRVVLRRLVDRLLEVEADADDQVAAIGDHGLDVGSKVGVRAGLSRVDLDAQAGLGAREAVIRGLVEGLVVPAAGVGDRAGLEGRSVLSLARATAGPAGASPAATCGQRERCNARRSDELREVLHEYVPLLMRILR